MPPDGFVTLPWGEREASAAQGLRGLLRQLSRWTRLKPIIVGSIVWDAGSDKRRNFERSPVYPRFRGIRPRCQTIFRFRRIVCDARHTLSEQADGAPGMLKCKGGPVS
jgi:hypothetical protein